MRPIPGISWSLSGNFPAGPDTWNGMPLAVQPPGTWYTPKVKLPAEELNWLFGSLAKQDSDLLDWAGNDPALNFGTRFAANDRNTNASWDTLNKQFILATSTNSGTTSVFKAKGGIGTVLADLTLVGNTVGLHIAQCACADDVLSNWFYHAGFNTGSPRIDLYSCNTTGANTWNTTKALVNSNRCEVVCMQGKAIFAAGGASAAGSGITWTSNQGTSYTDIGYSTVGTIPRWQLKVSGPRTQVLAIPRRAAITPENYYTTPDGSTYTLQAFSTLVVNTGDIVNGLTWMTDSGGSAWLMGVQKSGGTQAFYRSSDGVNWVAVGSGFTTASFFINDMAAVGALIVATTTDTSGASSLIFSIDGGVTWRKTQVGFATNISSVDDGFTLARVIAGQQGFMTINGGGTRWGALCGLGDIVT